MDRSRFILTLLGYLISCACVATYPCSEEPADESTVALVCFGIDGSNVAVLTSQLDAISSNNGVQINLELLQSAISDLPSDLLWGYPIRSLSLNEGNLTAFPQTLLENVNSNLTVLNLASNAISVIRDEDFDKLPFLESLEILVLSHNSLTTLPDTNVFWPFTNLRKLLLQMNGLQALPGSAFRDLNELSDLFLYANEIKEVAPDAFGNLPKLEKLYISENNIETLENGTWSDDKFPALKKIYIGNNPFVCDCELQWLNFWLGEGDLLFGSDATCGSPEHWPFTFVNFCPETKQENRIYPEKWAELLDNTEEILMKDPRERAYRKAHGLYM